MKSITFLLTAAAFAMSPAAVVADPGGHGGGGGHGSAMGSGMGQAMGNGAVTHGMSMGQGAGLSRELGPSQRITTQQGSTHGKGWDHMNGPTKTGQPGVECEEVRPGRSADAKGSAFNEEGTGHQHYAGEQPQNSRNTASISQYDIACLNQPQR